MAKGKKKKNKSSGGSFFSTLTTFGSGVILGVMVAPYARESLKKLTPAFDEALDRFSATASDVVERGADILAQARENLRERDSKQA